jgi:outer membrane protein TolC
VSDLLDPSILNGLEEYWTAEDTPVMKGDQPGEAKELTVQQCVDMALAENGQVLVAQDEVDAAAAKTGQAGSVILPQVKAQMGFVYVEGLESMGSSGLLNVIMPGVLTGQADTRRDQLSIRQVLYAGGQIRAAMRASTYLMNAQEWKKQAAINNLVFETQSAYFNCLLARAMVRVAEESVVTFERHVADAQQMFEVGLISNFEILRAKTELGARQSDAVAARNGERLALVNLRRIICMEQDAPIQL